MNLLAGRVFDGELRIGEARVGAAAVARESSSPVVGLRPEAFRIRSDGMPSPSLSFVVDVVEQLGHEVVVHGHVATGEEPSVVARLDAHEEPRHGDVLELTYALEDVHLFDGDSGVRLDA